MTGVLYCRSASRDPGREAGVAALAGAAEAPRSCADLRDRLPTTRVAGRVQVRRLSSSDKGAQINPRLVVATVLGTFSFAFDTGPFGDRSIKYILWFIVSSYLDHDPRDERTQPHEAEIGVHLLLDEEAAPLCYNCGATGMGILERFPSLGKVDMRDCVTILLYISVIPRAHQAHASGSHGVFVNFCSVPYSARPVISLLRYVDFAPRR